MTDLDRKTYENRVSSASLCVGMCMTKTVEPVVAHSGANRGKVVLECPRCHWIFEAERPDGLHPTSSFEKPQKSSVKSDVIDKNHVCRNPKCKNAFTIYWFETDFFNRI